MILPNTITIGNNINTPLPLRKRPNFFKNDDELQLNEFNSNEISSQPGNQIPWRTIIEIIGKSKSHEEKINTYCLFYALPGPGDVWAACIPAGLSS